MNDKTVDQRKVVTPLCRISYPHLFKPYAVDPEDEPKFQASFILPEDADVKSFQKAIVAAAKDKWPEDYKKVVKGSSFHNPLKEQAEYDKVGYGDAGYFVRSSSTRKPGVVHNDAARTPVIDPEEVFGGLLVHGSLRAFGWENKKGGKGVSFSLENVMVVKDDGTRYDSRTTPDEDFAGLDYGNDDDDGSDLPDDTDGLFD